VKQTWRWLVRHACLTALLIVLSPLAGAAQSPSGVIPWGVYDPEGEFRNDTEVSIEHLFLPWEDVDLTALLDADAYALARTRALLVTVEPWTWTRDERNTPEALLSGIRSGVYDANMRSICAVLNTLQSPISVRWAQEMDAVDGQFIWAQWTPADYIASYRRMIDVCRQEAPRVNVVWSPLANSAAPQYYPGDDYVDLVGLSVFGYQPWEELTLDRSRSYRDILDERYAIVSGFGKPVVMAELGYSGTADDIAP
jgi:endoglucanase